MCMGRDMKRARYASHKAMAEAEVQRTWQELNLLCTQCWEQVQRVQLNQITHTLQQQQMCQQCVQVYDQIHQAIHPLTDQQKQAIIAAAGGQQAISDAQDFLNAQ